eukprot:CAMPEP_0170485102 /NCGR_PEP_ID=MMETSP0208-20121228/4431_1 /TAXON_ID=197538 /ORGANISM="Strombidium inclinatum, Strain S3" /LENGTH=42 /DNA_ID= /DNA_START= /DNA_END= /DNA_ORIENTATION=
MDSKDPKTALGEDRIKNFLKPSHENTLEKREKFAVGLRKKKT